MKGYWVYSSEGLELVDEPSSANMDETDMLADFLCKKLLFVKHIAKISLFKSRIDNS